MKYFYTLMASATLLATSATAAPATLKVDHNTRSQLVAKTGVVNNLKQAKGNRLRVTSLAEAQAMAINNTTKRAKSPAHRAPEADDWTSAGTGVWVEGIMTIFGDIPSDLMWNVDIETSESNPGWYRLMPYSEESPVAELFGAADNTYAYVNATDPEKVYIEDFVPWGVFLISQYVVENEYEDGDYYGTLANSTITFPDEAFVLYTMNGDYAFTGTGTKLYLPGAEVKDERLSVSVDTWCTHNDAIDINLNVGADVASVKMLPTDGYLTVKGNADMQALINEYGQAVPVTATTVPLTEIDINSIYSLLAVALDAEGNVVNSAQCYFFRNEDENDQWEDLGTGTYDEAIYIGSYDDIEPETLTVTVQKHVTDAGRYRLVNPYATHSVISDGGLLDHSHNHYIYLNTTAAGRMYVEHSTTGVDLGYGEGAIYSPAALYADTEHEATAAEQLGCYATVNDNVITLADGMLGLGELDYQNGAFLQSCTGFKITLPRDDENGVANVAADASALDAPVEYFNLQGVRVARAEAGTLVIKRQGAKVTKSIMR